MHPLQTKVGVSPRSRTPVSVLALMVSWEGCHAEACSGQAQVLAAARVSGFNVNKVGVSPGARTPVSALALMVS